jgi:hypothetical protein
MPAAAWPKYQPSESVARVARPRFSEPPNIASTASSTAWSLAARTGRKLRPGAAAAAWRSASGRRRT